ncbi:hypothetical protein ABBQ32_011226 [Trebouxia sp. C0010 RCD-2024]
MNFNFGSDLGVAVGASAEARLDPTCGQGPALLQDIPFASGSEWLGKAWNDHFLFDACHPSLQLFPGSTVNTTAVAPTLWTDSFPPIAAIEPVLPDPQHPNEPVGFKEVFAADSQVIDAAPHPTVPLTPLGC